MVMFMGDLCSSVLGLQLQVEDKLIAFTEIGTGQQLLRPGQLGQALQQDSGLSGYGLWGLTRLSRVRMLSIGREDRDDHQSKSTVAGH